MLPSSTETRKRKHHDEYYDPNYGQAIPVKKVNTELYKKNKVTHFTGDFTRISTIIALVFRNEKLLKQEHLKKLDKRLIAARTCLDHLRFGILQQYYRKQELLISASDAAAVRGKKTLLEDSLRGLQMQLHPSFKFITCKRPRSHSKIICTQIPKCATTQNSIQTWSQLQKLQERRIQHFIRGQGLVIDHSKIECDQCVPALQSTKVQIGYNNSIPSPPVSSADQGALGDQGNVLNISRLNNKQKYIIVIGNTSTYIGQDTEGSAENPWNGGNIVTHKWLVYLQSRDSKNCLEYLIKKVRFNLHPSYRPNDVVDVLAAPFQITRRGWGEFPIRIQLYFHENLNQKPLQLIHHLVLDRTLSGMHTLGAETLIEIWLRTGFEGSLFNNREIIPANFKDLDILNHKETITMKTLKNCTSSTHNNDKQELYGNLIRQTAPKTIGSQSHNDLAHIKKYYFTSMAQNFTGVPLPQESLKTISTDSVKFIFNNSQRLQSNQCSNIDTKALVSSKYLNTSKKPNIEDKQKSGSLESDYINTTRMEPSNVSIKTAEIETGKDPTQIVHAACSVVCTTPKQINSHTNASQRNNNNIIALSRVEKLLPAKLTHRTEMTLPIAKCSPVNVPTENIAVKKILQKKLVQLIDAEGNKKIMQVIAASNENCPIAKVAPSNNNKAEVPNLVPKMSLSSKSAKYINSSSANLTQTNDSKDETQNIIFNQSLPPYSKTNTMKQIVFQRDGKLFIIDPLQIKFKQESRKQISLLKPQSYWQGQHQQKSYSESVQSKALQCMMSDHDYTSSLVNRDIANSAISTQNEKFFDVIKLLNDKMLSKESKFKLGIKQPHVEMNNYFEVLQKQLQFDKVFLTPNVVSIRYAVDYILRRLPLITPVKTLASSVSFICQNQTDFDALPVMKQRACEWLRAKYVTYILRNHTLLKELNSTNNELFWSTREVLVYARCHGFTPKMKLFNMPYSLQPQTTSNGLIPVQKLNSDQPNNRREDNSSLQKQFSTCLRQIVKLEENYFHFGSLTPNNRIISWLHGAYQYLKIEKITSKYNNESIDIINMSTIREADDTIYPPPDCSHLNFPPILGHLSESSMLVSDFFRDINIQVKPDVDKRDATFFLVHKVMAHCLNVFIEKLIRRTLASHHNASIAYSLNITKGDIGKILFRHAEFDFLTSKNFGRHEEDF